VFTTVRHLTTSRSRVRTDKHTAGWYTIMNLLTHTVVKIKNVKVAR